MSANEIAAIDALESELQELEHQIVIQLKPRVRYQYLKTDRSTGIVTAIVSMDQRRDVIKSGSLPLIINIGFVQGCCTDSVLKKALRY